ncbi:MAG TPA: alpha/beta hydrolase, partial [Geobacteraceae bacterium]
MPTLTTSAGAVLHYTDTSAGLPVIFLHGWLMSGKVWHYQQPLADRYRLIALDLRGHGESTGPDGYALADFAADLVALVDQLSLPRVVVVGWSLGAQVALQAASLLGGRLAGLVLIGATPRFSAGDGFEHGLPPSEARGMGLRLKRQFLRTAGEFFTGMFAPAELDGRQRQAIARQVVGRLPEPPAALAALGTLASADLRPLLPCVHQPVLLIHGTADTICLAAAPRYLAGQLPAARLQLMRGLGHAPFLSRPEQVNQLLGDFLESLH